MKLHVAGLARLPQPSIASQIAGAAPQRVLERVNNSLIWQPGCVCSLAAS
jgi:hypothetical protein